MEPIKLTPDDLTAAFSLQTAENKPVITAKSRATLAEERRRDAIRQVRGALQQALDENVVKAHEQLVSARFAKVSLQTLNECEVIVAKCEQAAKSGPTNVDISKAIARLALDFKTYKPNCGKSRQRQPKPQTAWTNRDMDRMRAAARKRARRAARA